jgi:aspartyl/asparaginyl beta-hydroxylase (cupin superfamily)
MTKLWFSIFDFSFDYRGQEPGFIEERFNWTEAFENQYTSIETELFEYLKNQELEAYFNQSMVNRSNTWKTISLKWWGIEFRKRQKFFPVTSALLKEYPELISLSFNQLEPHGMIKPHCGDTNAIFRCHMGIEIPDVLPLTGLRVKNEWREWKKGKWLIFMDAYNHEALNNSDKKRIIMVVDYLRPEFQRRKKKVISTVLTSLFLQKRAERWPILKKTPKSVIKTMTLFLRPFAFIAVKWVNFFKVY